MAAALFDLGTEEHRRAVISECGLYRYRLDRVWNDALPTAAFIMLNPSTADGLTDDPTIRRCRTFAKAWGCGSLTVVNLYAWRATDPRQLWTAGNPVGPGNNRHLTEAAEYAPLVAAWGANARPGRIAEVLALPGMQAMTALALTKSGQPRHPLYLPNGLTPQPWSPR